MQSNSKQREKMLKLLQNGFHYLLVLTLALGLKYHYSRADSEDLLWILGPTAKMVEVFSGQPFVHEIHTGFTSLDHQTIIAPACAGVNFLITVSCMLAFTGLVHVRHPGLRRVWTALSFLAAYCLTLCVNTIRILSSIYFASISVPHDWLTHKSLHRLEGVIVFFVSLSVAYFLLRKVIYRVNRYHLERTVKPAPRKSSAVSMLKSGIVPVCWYLAVALGIPIINGAFVKNGLQPHFMTHGVMVVSVCLVAFVAIFLIRLFIRWTTEAITNDR